MGIDTQRPGRARAERRRDPRGHSIRNVHDPMEGTRDACPADQAGVRRAGTRPAARSLAARP